MTPEQTDAMARQAGAESGECFPGDTPWRRLFVELVEDHLRGAAKMIADSESQKREIQQLNEINALREALSYYAESSNWRREVHTIGLRKAWKKPAVASDRGGMARLVLMTMEGEKNDGTESGTA